MLDPSADDPYPCATGDRGSAAKGEVAEFLTGTNPFLPRVCVWTAQRAPEKSTRAARLTHRFCSNGRGVTGSESAVDQGAEPNRDGEIIIFLFFSMSRCLLQIG